MPNSSGPLSGNRKKLTNHPRDRGISPPQRAIQVFDEGDRVHLKLDPSVPNGRFAPQFIGQTGTVVGRQGTAYQVRITDGGKEKILITTAAHLALQAEG